MTHLPSSPAFGDAAWALACGGLLAFALERPWIAAAVVACHLLPPWFAAALHAWRLDADITLTLDPSAPEPGPAARAFHAAAAQAGASGRPVTLRLLPLCDARGEAVPIRLELTRAHEAICRVGTRSGRPFPAEAWLPRHPLPLTVGHAPVLLRFRVEPDRRLATCLVSPLGQRTRLLAHAALCAAALPSPGPLTLAAAAAGLLAAARPVAGDQSDTRLRLWKKETPRCRTAQSRSPPASTRENEDQ